MTDGPPQKLRRKTPPGLRKARDDARLRKLTCRSSDKAARRKAPRIKALANWKLRRILDRNLAADPVEVSFEDVRVASKQRDRHWGSHNVADRREAMAVWRAILNSVPPAGRSGWGRLNDALCEWARKHGYPDDAPIEQLEAAFAHWHAARTRNSKRSG